MTDENDYKKSLEKLVKQFSNGVTHNLILWIISKENIHGYGIMKKLEDFFTFDSNQCDVKVNSSKIYPILSQMEEGGLITGEWKINDNNKRVKYYSLTDNGEKILKEVQFRMNSILNNPTWISFFKDMTGKEFNDEKCNND